MEYLRAYQYVFDSPRWLANLLLNLLCMFIPAIGPIVNLGYHYEVIEELHLSGGKRYTDFTFERFMVYVGRGVWPFIIQILISMPLAGMLVFCWIFMVVAAGAAANNANATPVIPICFFSFMALVVIASFVIQIVLVPLALWAGLAQDFKPGPMWEFMREFCRLVLWDMIVALFVNALLAMAVGMVGLLTCIGYLPAIMLVQMAVIHITWQLYELYLQRGGTEIPLKIEEGTRPS